MSELFGCEHILREAGLLLREVIDEGQVSTDWIRRAKAVLDDIKEYNPRVLR